VPDPGGAVPLLHGPAADPAGRAHRHHRGTAHPGDDRDHAQRDVADGRDHDGRHRGLEQHFDRGVRAPAGGAGPDRGAGGDRVVPHPPAADSDDLAGHDDRPDPAGAETGRGQRGVCAAGAGHHRRLAGFGGLGGVCGTGGVCDGLWRAHGAAERSQGVGMNLGKLIEIALALGMAGAVAQTTPPSPAGPPLTLAQAQAAALARRPLLQEAQSQANAAGQEPAAVRATEMPQLAGDLTGVGAEANSRITAGGLNNPVIYSRYANGINVSQLVTNFGRTGQLVKSASNQAQAQRQDAAATRADVLLQVDRAYFSALQAQAVLRVAQQAVEERQLIARQVGVLAQNKLRSNLDVSFAQVNLA